MLYDGMLAACTKGGDGVTYAEHVNVALAVSMPDGGLITPVIKVRVPFPWTEKTSTSILPCERSTPPGWRIVSLLQPRSQYSLPLSFSSPFRRYKLECARERTKKATVWNV